MGPGLMVFLRPPAVTTQIKGIPKNQTILRLGVGLAFQYGCLGVRFIFLFIFFFLRGCFGGVGWIFSSSDESVMNILYV